MSRQEIDETCACGARFVWAGDSAYAKTHAADFRANHRHAEPALAVEPGLCWADSGTTWPNGVSPRCELRAGHLGAHECDRGDMGGSAVWTDDDATEEATP